MRPHRDLPAQARRLVDLMKNDTVSLGEVAPGATWGRTAQSREWAGGITETERVSPGGGGQGHMGVQRVHL